MSDENPYSEEFDNPQRQTPFRSARYAYAQQTSAMAVVSVIAGVLSFPMMCLCFMSIPLSLLAIFTGHSARATVRRSGGAYTGSDMAMVGLILGYAGILISGAALLMLTLASTVDQSVITTIQRESVSESSQGAVLLRQAEGQLLADSEQLTSGVSTCEHDATDLANHFVETLHIVDKTQFAETNSDAPPEHRPYRAFVQLNADSAAFLLFVPDYVRFTDSAKEALSESCWLIAQRSVDDLLLEGSSLAVAIYSNDGCQQRMVGVTKRSGPAKAGLKASHAGEKRLAEFFKLQERPVTESTSEEFEFDSQIDNKPAPGDLTLPAEAE